MADYISVTKNLTYYPKDKSPIQIIYIGIKLVLILT